MTLEVIDTGVIAKIRSGDTIRLDIDDVHQSIDLAQALIAGGINVLEITLRTPAAIDSIRLLAKMVPGAVVGMVLNTVDLLRVRDASAKFAISLVSTKSCLKKR
jgi:2-dehydro-3-deoxyphosphogluconate aldolase/(4S)-4-hydroxy-2-oxoglutarate aldolase